MQSSLNLKQSLRFLYKMNIFNDESRDKIAKAAIKLHLIPTKRDYNELMEAIGPARVVLIGEASHGTHEFYRERALISKRLIEEHDFTCIAIEGDFPDVFRVNQYIQHLDKHYGDKNSSEALQDFHRFPRWMWRNHVMTNFLQWLRHHNDTLAKDRREVEKIAIAGLDVYSLHRSADAVIEYLQQVDPSAAEKAKENYDCFERFGDDTMLYAFSARYKLAPTCESEAFKVLKNLRTHTQEYLEKTQDGLEMENHLFGCLMNAYVVQGAEKYYRVMLDTDATSWNMRDEFMVQTFERFLEWKSKLIGRPAKGIIWAHNSHIGDARYTEMGRRRREHNIGQLIRQRFGEGQVFNIGFSTYEGEVTCATEWSQKKIERKKVNPGMEGSTEKFFHEITQKIQVPNFMLIFKHIVKEKDETALKIPTATHPLPEVPKGKVWTDFPIVNFPLQRFIGVIYRPLTERQSHYSECVISEQYDAVIHMDYTHALLALDDKAKDIGKEEENLPELFPSGL